MVNCLEFWSNVFVLNKNSFPVADSNENTETVY